jgi:hypothetical protein
LYSVYLQIKHLC